MKMRLRNLSVIALIAAGMTGFAVAKADAQASHGEFDLSAGIAAPEASTEITPVEPPAKPEPPVAAAKPQPPTVPPLKPERRTYEFGKLPKLPMLGAPGSLSPDTTPEVLIAEAQLREAQARLQQAKVEAAQRAIENTHRQKLVDMARTNVERLEQMARNGSVPMVELSQAQERLAQVEADLAKLEAASQFVDANAGSPGSSAGLGAFNQPRFPAPRPELAKDDDSPVIIALNAAINIEFEEETLRNISGFISEYVGVNIVMDVGLRAADEPVSIRLDDVPFRDALLALADAYGDVCFVIRDYGIFATTAERAMTINAPTIPANVPLLVSMQDASAPGFAVGGFGFGGGGISGGGGFGMGTVPGAPSGGFGFGGGGIQSRGRAPGPVDAQEYGKESGTRDEPAQE